MSARRIGNRKYLAAVAILLIATIGTAKKDGLFNTPESTPLEVPFDQFPTEINGWKLVGPEQQELEDYELEFIQPTAYLRRAYRKGDDVVMLYLAYYGNRLEGQRRIHHNATVCMVAAGYDMDDVAEGSDDVEIFNDIAKGVPLDHIYFTKQNRDYFVTQFFSVDGKLMKESPKPKSAPIARLVDRFKTLEDAGFCFQVQVGHVPRGDVDGAREVHVRFLRDTVKAILRHFPAESWH